MPCPRPYSTPGLGGRCVSVSLVLAARHEGTWAWQFALREGWPGDSCLLPTGRACLPGGRPGLQGLAPLRQAFLPVCSWHLGGPCTCVPEQCALSGLGSGLLLKPAQKFLKVCFQLEFSLSASVWSVDVGTRTTPLWAERLLFP